MKMGKSLNISSDRIKEILEELGYTLVDRGQYWHSNAAFRQGDNTTALQIWKNSGVWRDFVENTPPLPFIKLLVTHLGTNDPEVLKKYTSDHSPLNTTIKNCAPKLSLEKTYPSSLLDELFPHYDFYNKKGIEDHVLKHLHSGLATKGQMYQRYVFPIYNEDGKIHGFSGRDLSGRDGVPKWKHIGRKTNWIYPYFVKNENEFQTADSIQDQKRVFLVESIGDLLNLHQHGYYNVLVTFGLDISPKLICHLIGLDDPEIVISFNNDYDKTANRGARAAVKNYLKLLNHFDLQRLRICLPTKNDFGEMNTTDFDAWSQKYLDLSGALQLDDSDFITEITAFANKMATSNELPKHLLKNIKILNEHLK